MSKIPETFEKIFEQSGVKINGPRAHDIQVYNKALFQRVLAEGSLGLGEAYLEGRRDCDQLDEFFTKILRAGAYGSLKPNMKLIWQTFQAKRLNRQSKKNSPQHISHHYDLDADFYLNFLDSHNQYSCAYFQETDSLETAQQQKLDLICRKLQLTEADSVLDIGCGRGGLAKYMAEHYGCRVKGISLSKTQVAQAQKVTAGLPVEISYQDYRDLTGTYTKIVSVGMIEHIGPKNYRTMMEVARRSLADDGLFLLHTIAGNESTHNIDPWIDKYIFPGAVLPSAEQLSKAVAGVFVIEDWHNFGQYYDPTLMARWRNFERHLPQIEQKYGPTFVRIRKYYFLSCAASFRSRMNQLYQLVLSKKGIMGGYESVR